MTNEAQKENKYIARGMIVVSTVEKIENSFKLVTGADATLYNDEENEALKACQGAMLDNMIATLMRLKTEEGVLPLHSDGVLHF